MSVTAISSEELNALLFDAYISGLVDGEGCFSFHFEESRWSASFASFGVGLRLDDAPVLRRIQRRFRCGRIKIDPGGGPKANPRATLLVTNVTELASNVIPFFLKNPLQAKKARDFDIWKEIIFLLLKIKTRPNKQTRYGRAAKWESEEADQLQILSNQLKETRKYVGPSPEEVRERMRQRNGRSLS